MSTKHTPGPWSISQHSRKMRSCIQIAAQHGHTFTIMAHPPVGSQHRICIVDGPSNRELSAECAANARIIGNAPLTLAALVDLYEQLDSFQRETIYGRNARAAIAKAAQD